MQLSIHIPLPHTPLRWCASVQPVRANPAAYDPKASRALWEASAQLTGIPPQPPPGVGGGGPLAARTWLSSIARGREAAGGRVQEQQPSPTLPSVQQRPGAGPAIAGLDVEGGAAEVAVGKAERGREEAAGGSQGHRDRPSDQGEPLTPGKPPAGARTMPGGVPAAGKPSTPAAAAAAAPATVGTPGTPRVAAAAGPAAASGGGGGGNAEGALDTAAARTPDTGGSWGSYVSGARGSPATGSAVAPEPATPPSGLAEGGEGGGGERDEEEGPGSAESLRFQPHPVSVFQMGSGGGVAGYYGTPARVTARARADPGGHWWAIGGHW